MTNITTSRELIEEAVNNLRIDRTKVYARINALVKESKGYSQPQKELSIAKSIGKLFDVLQKINSEIIKLSTQLNRMDDGEYIFDSLEGQNNLYSSIGDEITVAAKEESLIGSGQTKSRTKKVKKS